jgi:hypothetical protein
MSDTTLSPPISRDRVPIDRAELIDVTGADAIAFAHAQFSSDVAGIAPGAWQWSAWLTAQGRVHAVFALLRVADDRLLLWLPLGGARVMRDALARYVLRANVRLEIRNWALAAASTAASGSAIIECDGGYAFALKDARMAWLGPLSDAPPDPRALDAWRLADVAAGLPWIALATQDEFVPQALDLQRLDAIRFDKGCFPGQEIAARLHFRGGVKQRLRRVTLRGDSEVSPGLRIEASGNSVGVLLYGAPSGEKTFEALAVVGDAIASDIASTTPHRHTVRLHDGLFV